MSNPLRRFYLYGKDDIGGRYDALVEPDENGDWCYAGDALYALERKDAQIQCLECDLAAMTDAYENMRDFAKANGLDTTASNSPPNQERSKS